jgi:Family of unknown function (DUF6459)
VTTPPTSLPLPLQRPPAPQRGFSVVSRLAPPERDDIPLASVQGTLALDLEEVPPQLSAPPEPTSAHLALAPAPDDAADEVKAWARRFAQAVVEVAGGDRPVTQLLRWTTPGVYQDLGRRVQIMAQTRSAPERLRTIRPQVLSVHVFQPKPTSVEVSVHVRYGLRSRALAARMERRRGAWTCTDLQLG